MVENTKNSTSKVDKPECPPLTPEEVLGFINLALEIISGEGLKTEVTLENFRDQMEDSMLSSVKGLPESLEKNKIKTAILNNRATELLKDIS